VTKPFRILIVEDHSPDVFLVQKALRENHVTFELTRFEDGEQAMLAIQKRGPVTLGMPDLIILDLNLPKIDGMEILREIRKDPSMAKVPIAILTSSGALQDKVEAIASGANRFITKPVDLRSFVGTVGGSIRELLDQSRSLSPAV
jgi:two-component system, chemotaxis family, response regulator Rcp1